MGVGVLLYWPNIIGYIRVGLVFAAWAAYETPAVFVPLYAVSTALDGGEGSSSSSTGTTGAPAELESVDTQSETEQDLPGVDGWLARRLGQSSRFGAWLDVVVDNTGRGMLWSLLFEWGWLVSALEWCVFVCNHNTRGDHWKDSFTTSPRFIQAIMANGFRTPLGAWVVSGLHCLPLWLYGCRWGLLAHWLYLPSWIQTLGTMLLGAGRLLALSAEIWCIWTHIEYLTSDEEPEGKKN